jgi:hypothetical protein
VAHLTSFDQTQNDVFDVPFKDPAVMMDHIGGSYPWHIDGDYQSVIHVRNTTNQPARFTIQFDFQGGSYAMPIQMLAPQQEADINVRALRDGQVKDSIGRVIPLSVTSGRAGWHEHGAQPLIGRAEVYSASAGVASSFSCGDCCYYTCSVVCGPEPMDGMPGTTGVLSLLETQCCVCNTSETDGPYDVSTSATWSSSNTAVATVTDTAGSVKCACIAPGTANITSNFLGTNQLPAGTCEDSQEFTDVCEVMVGPQITSISPSRGCVGFEDLSVTITGSNFTPPNTSVTITADTSITVDFSSGSATNTQLLPTFSIASNASGGNHTITVTVTPTGSGTPASATTNFYVQPTADPLQQPVSELDMTPRRMRETFYLALQSAHVPGGAVVLHGCEAQEPMATIPITPGTTLREVLDALVRANPTYRWEVNNGVINLLPAAGEPPLLRVPIPQFHAQGLKSVSSALGRIEQLPEVRQGMANLGLGWGTTPIMEPFSLKPPPTFDVTCDGVTLRGVLNEVARRAAGTGYWEYFETRCGSTDEVILMS